WLIGGRRGDRPSIPSDLSQTLGEVEAADVVAAVNHLSPALVVAEYSSTAPLLAECDVPLRAVLLHDVFALRARAFADHAIPPDHARLSVDQEQRRVAAANICIYASLREKATLSKGLPGQTHIWLPPRVATCDYPEESDPFAVFVGVRHGGNTDSLHMLLNDIWPRVLDQHPEAKLRIAGEICEAVSCPPRGVTLLGHVPDLGSVGGPDAIGLAPVRAASGVSIKVANYLGCGMSVLASPPALDGYDDTLSDLVQIADDPDSFADALVALFKNHTLRRQRARRGVRELPGRLDNRDIVSVLSSMAMRAGAVEKPKSEQNLTCAS
ncbi:MAG: glycosyltransferase family 4 protein, partial [Marinibacterium sp.]|nr:glycosyltransferase family 4 protein [Marinibacterium sp.]